MEDNHLVSFEVSGFKKFLDLKVENIGQFNLIVGDNNVGKTTLLEALLVDKTPVTFLNWLAGIMRHIKKFSGLNDFFIAQYFSDSVATFPRTIDFKLIKKNLLTNFVKIVENRNADYRFAYTRNSDIQDHQLTQIQRNLIAENTASFSFEIPYIPFGAQYGEELTKQYSEHIQLFVDRKERLIDSLTQIINDIKNIEVNASYSNNPILLISEKGKNKLSPLATYGDASIKLFRILLSLFANDFDRLMVDEIDAGVHYSRLKDFLKSFLRIAKDQKRQIFASTHSKECIEYFTLALKELGYENDGRIIRLAHTKSGIKAYTNVYEQFENSLKADSEIR
jgi:AAA15 family ATPase/GTPase